MNHFAQRLAVRLILTGVFVAVLITVIAYARGYRFNFSQKKLDSTGILVASSYPDGAKIYLNGELFGATNQNIIIEPGDYAVDIKKDGFTTWTKKLKIKGELVIKADALLFPNNPSLSPVTSLGLIFAQTSPTKGKSILMSQTNDLEKDGIYVLENNRNPLSSVSESKLLILKSALPANADLAKSTIEFSPDESEAIITIRSASEPVILGIYLVNLSEAEQTPFSITRSVDTVRTAWQTEAAKLRTRKIQTYKKPLPSIITSSFDIISFSPDEEKILYKSLESVELPVIIKPRLIATNQTPETRLLEKGGIYIYDSKEDKNYLVFSPKDMQKLGALQDMPVSDWLFWYPDSAHIIMMRPNDEGIPALISVTDYDGTNMVDVYTGPFENNYLSITRDGKLLILTNFNARSGALPDVYTVGIK